MPDDEANVLLTPEGPVAAFPLPGGQWRLVDTTGIVVGDDPDKIVARFRELVTGNGFPDAEFGQVYWTSAFHIHRRVVDRFRVGRVFVAGDAAHLHSPAGGQGMNTGIQDAYNLAWKLGLVHAGASADSLLDSYQAERRPVAIGVLKGSDRLTRLVTFRNPIARGLRDRLLGVLSEFDFVRRRVSHGASELESATGRARSSRTAGDDSDRSTSAMTPTRATGRPTWPSATARRRGSRTFLAGTKHVLLLCASEFSGLVEVIRGRHAARIKPVLVVPNDAPPGWPGEVVRDPEGHLQARYGGDSLTLIRPDGYIAYRSRAADAAGLAAYLDRIFPGQLARSR